MVVSLDDFVDKGRQASGLDDTIEILKWFGFSRSTINNCRQRGHVPLTTLVPALLGRNLSLDWFFRPQGGLGIPVYRDNGNTDENALQFAETARYGVGQSAHDRESLAKVVSYFHALLARHQALASEEHIDLMWAVYQAFPVASELRTQVMEALAASLASRQH
ncbi:MAG: hypothetical protein LAT77_11420 [Aliidiomarina sp.]|uniref:hypothetical protein n=1 Tax=Aliidiomarina sp. TaxID=1872439 RepID=UPI0025C41F33|nr:hypothetical protein [Aliidiomarina sp.]MCH8502504.1 hypothetical protein [Aliidiomarina sp.]